MQKVKIKYSQKPHLKKSANFFDNLWYRWRVYLDNRRYDYYDRHRRHVVIRLLSLIGITLSIVLYSAFAPRPSGTVSTKLNTPQSFGTQGKNVQITRRVFNKKTGTMLVNLKFSGTNDTLVSDVNLKRFKLSFAGDRYIRKGQSKANIIPTSVQTMVIQFTNLRPGFQDVRIKVADKTLDDTNIEAVTSASSSSQKMKVTDDKATLVINNDDQLKRDDQLQVATQKTLVLAQTKTNIQTQKGLIAANKKAIDKWQKAISDKNENIRITQQQMGDMINDELAQANSLIESNKGAIMSAQSNIVEAKSDITSADNKIKALHKLYLKQENGELGVPKPY